MTVRRLAPACVVSVVFLYTLALAVDAGAQLSARGPLAIIVGFAPGGTTDTVARLLASDLSQALGRDVTVQGRLGAGGRVAAAAFSHSPADGSKLMLAPVAVTVVAPLLYRHLDYDPERDFVRVSQLARYQFAVVVAADSPVRDMAGLVERARTRPVALDLGTPGAGTLADFMVAMLGKRARMDLVRVPYKGTLAMATDLAAGRLDAALDALPDVIDLQRGGTVRIIATTGGRRSALLPGVPTLVEQGFPGLVADGWIALYAPAGTRRDVAGFYADAAFKALHAAPTLEKLQRLGLEPTGTSPEELTVMERNDSLRWAEAIKTSGFSAD